jgi:hypothetical protein
MAVVTPVIFYPFVVALGSKKHDLSTDTLKWVLTNNAPSRAWSVTADITGELATGGGYTNGGATSTVSGFTQTLGVAKLILADPTVWTGTGSGFGPFRYAILRNSTATNGDIILYVDHGSSISVAATQTYTIDLDQTNGTLQVSVSA